jgi:chemotaxis protein CheD
MKLAAMAHIVLPGATGRPGLPGKFADTAVPFLIDLLEKEGVSPAGLAAIVAGGARMFGKAGPLQIGDANVAAVTAALEKFGIPIRGKSVGGAKGRKLTFHGATGELTVEVAGEPPFTL